MRRCQHPLESVGGGRSAVELYAPEIGIETFELDAALLGIVAFEYLVAGRPIYEGCRIDRLPRPLEAHGERVRDVMEMLLANCEGRRIVRQLGNIGFRW